MTQIILGKYVNIEGIKLHYLEEGSGKVVLLLHGWPTSSFLWRKVIGEIARKNRVIAIDLPGFGLSDKPLGASYSFRFYSKILDGFLAALKIEKLSLAIHDLGGPIGLYWVCNNLERVEKLAFLNTIIYPELSWAVVAFVMACKLPVVSSILASSWGLKMSMKIGISDSSRLTEEAIKGFQTPFQSQDAQQALLKAGYSLHPKGLEEIAQKLPSLKIPVQILYGDRDRILPDVAKTMQRLQKDLPQAKVKVLNNCGHFLQEERPEEVGQVLSSFFGTD